MEWGKTKVNSIGDFVREAGGPFERGGPPFLFMDSGRQAQWIADFGLLAPPEFCEAERRRADLRPSINSRQGLRTCVEHLDKLGTGLPKYLGFRHCPPSLFVLDRLLECN